MDNDPSIEQTLNYYEFEKTKYQETVDVYTADYLHVSRNEIDDNKIDPRTIEGYVASGAIKDVFRAEIEGEPVAVKVLRGFNNISDESERRKKILAECTPLIKGAGIPHLEQLKAIDPEKGVIITSFTDGKKLPDLTNRELLSIKKRHIVELAHTLDEMVRHDLHPHNIEGVLFNKESGFNFVDYTTSTAGNNEFNIGWLDTTDLVGFIKYALADLNKYSELSKLEMDGMRVPDAAYRTTGVRGLKRAILARKAAKIDRTTKD